MKSYGRGKVVSWGAFGFVALFGFALFGCAYHERREFVVVPGAKKVWFNAKFLYDSTMTFEVDEPYPAEQTIAFLNKELKARGWIESGAGDLWAVLENLGEPPKSEEHLWGKSWKRRENEYYDVSISYSIVPGSDIRAAKEALVFSKYRYWETEK